LGSWNYSSFYWQIGHRLGPSMGQKPNCLCLVRYFEIWFNIRANLWRWKQRYYILWHDAERSSFWGAQLSICLRLFEVVINNTRLHWRVQFKFSFSCNRSSTFWFMFRLNFAHLSNSSTTKITQFNSWC